MPNSMQTEQNQGQTKRTTTTTPERHRVEHKVCKCKLTCQQWIRVVAWCLAFSVYLSNDLMDELLTCHHPLTTASTFAGAKSLNAQPLMGMELWRSMRFLRASRHLSAAASCTASALLPGHAPPRWAASQPARGSNWGVCRVVSYVDA